MRKAVIGQHLQWFRTWPSDLMYILSNHELRAIVDADVTAILPEIPYQRVGVGALNYCLLYQKSFRNIYFYRMKHFTILRHIARNLIRPLDSVEIYGDIGPGLRIYHNYCVIRVNTAGRNLVVKPGVVIGIGRDNDCHMETDFPTIGNDVTINANALVYGKIRIGDNSIIGGGTLVGKDIPSHTFAYGNPMNLRRI